MIIRFSLPRLSIVFSLVIILPLLQNQWHNLSQFENTTLSFYRFLYYLSGLICPLLVCLNSINKFTHYKFDKKSGKNTITGKFLLIITLILLLTLSILISNYIYFNFELFYKILINNKHLFTFDFNKIIFFILTISILLIFKITRSFLKKLILINFFMISIFIWYSQINNLLIEENLLLTKFWNIENINYINILFLLVIESFYYLWSYISYNSNLSDWIVVNPSKRDLANIIKIIIFYLFIFIYYSIMD